MYEWSKGYLFRLVIVVDAELWKQDLILVVGEGSFQLLLSLLISQAPLLNQSPEDGVVQVVDVAVNLAPAQIVSQCLEKKW